MYKKKKEICGHILGFHFSAGKSSIWINKDTNQLSKISLLVENVAICFMSLSCSILKGLKSTINYYFLKYIFEKTLEKLYILTVTDYYSIVKTL